MPLPATPPPITISFQLQEHKISADTVDHVQYFSGMFDALNHEQAVFKLLALQLFTYFACYSTCTNAEF